MSINSNSIMYNPCLIIPCYRHARALQQNIDTLLDNNIPIIIVDDGNTAEEKRILEEIVEKYNCNNSTNDSANNSSKLVLISNSINLGKGLSMKVAFEKAIELGFTHALQIDADGQQDISAISSFIELSKQHVSHMIVGTPIYTNVPKIRLLSRYITHFWVAVELGKFKIIDSMCGLRVYPLDAVKELLQHRTIGARMDFDTDIFVRLYWAGVDYILKPVDVTYPLDGVSNFAPFKDNVRISWMHTKLCFEKCFNFIKIHKREYF